MDKTVKWDETPPPSDSEPSDSPTLSTANKPKRKRSNIFTKIRKSILGLTGASGENDSADDEKVELKRALSMDAGLQKRISILSNNLQPVQETETTPDISASNNSNSRAAIRRSKSLVGSSSNANFDQRTLSHLQSPKQETDVFDALPSDMKESILEEGGGEKGLNPHEIVNFYNTIESTAKFNEITSGSFNCSWLAPTKKSQLFPGKLFLLPKSDSIQFYCQHFNRTIRLKFNFGDILNISRGTWNDQRNRALIIDLMRGKRKSWVFVAWTDDQFQVALDSIVKSWQIYYFNQIKQRIDNKRDYLQTKHSKIVKDADRAHQTIGKDVDLIFESIKNNLKTSWEYFMNNKNANENEILMIKPISNYSSKTVLYENQIQMIFPQILGQILCEQATNFMINFRALHGIVAINDSGWSADTSEGANNNSRSFVSLMTRDKLLKWKIDQEIKINSPDFFVFESRYKLIDSPNNSFKIIYELTSAPPQISNSNPTCNIKITGIVLEKSSTISEDEIWKYFRTFYFKSLFQLLSALIEESQNEFDTFESDFRHQEVLLLLPPHFRFVKESVRNWFLKVNVLITTLIIPFTFKLVHFKEFKPLRILILGLISFFILKSTFNFAFHHLKLFINNRPINFHSQFDNLIKDLTEDAVEGANSIHSLKFKYR